MPPYYDIYGLSKKRDKKTIEHFLERFCHREQIEHLDEGEIFIYENEKYGVAECLIAVNTVSEVIDYGINNPNYCFPFYIGQHLKAANHIILKFTYDEQVIFGISLQNERVENGQLVNNYDKAMLIEGIIAEITGAHKTSIQYEYAPASDEDEFNEDFRMWEDWNIEQRAIYNRTAR